ncbi:hypothetical protein [Falsirhodobacter sp. 1013]|uniref:hypothetical protein n=1 Tax=Falsirhodobacter sp. 1013 TaxID=3417566 RepID=UPI003EB7A509
MDDLFPDTITKAAHGAIWWAGNYECRNWHGYFQSREGGRGNWRFQVPWFSTDDVTCSVYAITEAGDVQTRDLIPIDDKARITIMGRKYTREHWEH